MSRINSTIAGFIKGKCGAVATEFAMALPLWLTLMLGCGDATYYILVNQRVDRVAYTVTDVVTQMENPSYADLDTVLLAASQLMETFSFNNRGVVIISYVYRATGETSPKIKWQYANGGSLVRNSAIGVTGGVPTMPNNMTLNEKDSVMVIEVYYSFDPIFANMAMFSSGDIYRTAVYKMRLGSYVKTPT